MTADWGHIDNISERVGCVFTVSDGLISRFLEMVYENAPAHELRKAGVSVARRHPMVAS